MPSVPLYYQPLVRAEIDAANIGKSTVAGVRDRQVNFAFIPQPDGGETLIQPTTKAAVDVISAPDSPVPQALAAFLTGIEKVQKSLPGSQMLRGITLAGDKDGWVANRVTTMFVQDPSALDMASPADAARMAAGLITKLESEYAARNGGDLELVGDTLMVAPETSSFIGKQLTAPETVSAKEAASFSALVNREMQRAVTPPGPGSAPVAWLEDATAQLLSVWPGSIEATAALLGMKADAVEIAAAAGEVRAATLTGPAQQGVNSLSRLLRSAGLDATSTGARESAFELLQRAPVEAVPGAIAQAIVGTNDLDPTKTEYLAGRIIETGGSEGAVSGLIAELSGLAKAPTPPTPPVPPIEDPAPSPPPEDPPPAEDPAPTPSDPPAEDPAPKPSDPPAEDPAPKPSDPPAGDPPAGDPSA